MSNTLHAMVVALVLVLVPPTTTAKAVKVTAPAPVVTTTTLVSTQDMADWNKVAWCETHGNWKHQGAEYEGGLGIMAWNWVHFGGTQYSPHAWLATPEQQVAIAIKIQHGLPTPDAGYCGSW